MEKIDKELEIDYNRINKLSQQMRNILLSPHDLTNKQEKQILKLKQKIYSIKARYFEKTKEFPYPEEISHGFNKIAEESKNNECRIFYLAQSKIR